MNFLLRFRFFIFPILAALLCLLWFVPRFGDRWFRRVEGFGTRFARKKGAVVVSIALATVLMRLALLGAMPVPVPCFTDEFSYLLAGDTFAHGRLANPPHSMWLFLETFHVLQHPTYASMYPPAEGAVLAFGQMLGNPWIGVLLSVAAMGAAVTWAMQAWLPPRWALLGGVLLVLRIGLISYWMNSYWGGAVAATGGALVIGALPRIMKRLRLGDAVLMALGAALLANSRPLEGLIFCVPVAAVVIAWLSSKQGPAAAVALPRVILPIAVVLLATLGFMAYYNWRVTGSALLFPEALDLKVYTNYLFLWQWGKPPLRYNNPQFEHYYNVMAYKLFPHTLVRSLASKSHMLWVFFLGSAFTIPLVAFPWVLKDRRMRLLVVQCVISGMGLLAVSPFFPHYAAPLTATLFILLAQAMRHLRLWKVHRRPLGLALCRLVVLLTVARVPYFAAYQVKYPECLWSRERAGLTRQPEATPGKHLVVVRYGPQHNARAIEWVYNGADLNEAKTVWARDIPGQDLEPLLDYYRDRKVWILEADVSPAHLRPYDGGGTRR